MRQLQNGFACRHTPAHHDRVTDYFVVCDTARFQFFRNTFAKTEGETVGVFLLDVLCAANSLLLDFFCQLARRDKKIVCERQ